MNWKKLFLLPLALLLICSGLSFADETGQENGLLQGFMDALGSAAKESLQDQMDEWTGTYEGRLGEVSLVERRGNAVVLDVTYEKVKKSDGVYVQGEVLSGGVPIDGYTNNLTQVSGKRGRVRLTISRESSGQDEWGFTQEDVTSDQIRLFLVRETHPDRPFGSIVYDLPKVWTGSSEPDVIEEPPASAESIELAEGESLEAPPQGTTVARPVLVGTILKPVQVKPAATASAGEVKPSLTVTQVSEKPVSGASPASAASLAIQPVPAGITHYDFYSQAAKATWRSGAGTLPFPGRANDNRGFVRQVAKGTLHTGNAAVELLQTHPQWKTNGWVAGRFADLTPAKGVHFKSIVGFLKGAAASDGATFSVQVYEKGRYYRLFKQVVTPDRYVNLDLDLSRWAGRNISLVLRVDAGKASAQDWAVWVKPRLSP